MRDIGEMAHRLRLERLCLEGHLMEVVHHVGEDGRHYCPTGWIACWQCCQIAEEPAPPSCTRWDE